MKSYSSGREFQGFDFCRQAVAVDAKIKP